MLAALIATVATAACPPLPGVAALFAKPGVRVIWVGEVHGTTEQPALFGDIVCAASKTGRPIVVALERSQTEQAVWDMYLASDGGPAARAALTNSPEWTSKFQDGRSSRAIAALAERLRGYKAEGRITAVHMIIPNERPDISAAEHESLMAHSVERARDLAPNTLVLAYSGNAHAQKAMNTFRGETYALAAARLPPNEVLSIKLGGGSGAIWACEAPTCGPHAYDPPTQGGPRGIVSTGAPEGFDAVAYTGVPTTASPPAARPATPVPLSGL